MSALHDLRFTIRQLRKSPGFAAATILTLGLGIGATTAIFSLVNAVLLRPLPFPDADRLVWAAETDRGRTASDGYGHSLSYPDFFDWRTQSRSFSGLASYRNDSVTMTGSGAPQHLDSAVVSAEFFSVLGVRPIVGREFVPAEEKPGARAVVLSYGLWQSAFGSAPGVAGSAITLDGHSYTVAGVMPAGFLFPIGKPEPALWTTLADDSTPDSPTDTPLSVQRGADLLRVVARLKPGVTVAQAHADLDLIDGRLAAQYPGSNKSSPTAVVIPEMERLTGSFRPALRLLFGAVVLVLLIACANVAGLLLARATRRRGEVALRAALGAGRGEIVRQMLAESIFLSLCGGALGVALSSWTLDALLRFVPSTVPRAGQISVDGMVLGFVLAVSLLTGLLFGGVPAWRMSRLDPSLALRDGGRSTTGGRAQHSLHHWLVIAETAVGLVLLVGSGLLIRSFVSVLRVQPGFDPGHVLTASLNLPESRYPLQKKAQFYNQLLARLAALPGVESAAAGVPLPLSTSQFVISFHIEGHPTAPGDSPAESVSVVSPDYFHTLRIPVVSGRAFTVRDDAKSLPVIIVNQRFARKYFAGENPIGKHVKAEVGDGTLEEPVREVVGVVGDVKRTSLMADADPQYYLPYAQALITSPTLAIRTAGDPAKLAGAIRTELAAMDRDIPLYRVSTLEDMVSTSTSQPRFQTLLLGCFAGIALLLSAIGLYSVLSYMVVQRTGEIGVRMALGAQRGDVLGMVIRRGLTLALAGIGIGLAASALLTRSLQGMLFGIQPFDPLTFAAVAGLLLIVSLAASSAPAWRAARVDPMRTLRDQ